MATRNSVCYARFSSDSQNPATIQTQHQQCEKAAGSSLTLYADEGRTGKTLARREALHRLLADASEGKISRVYVLRFDRLGRNEADTFTIVAELEDLGIEVISCQEGREALTRGIHLVVAAHYSRELSTKVRLGKDTSFRSHNWNGGTAPYGYKAVDKKLVIDEQEAPVVRLIFTSYNGATPMGLKSIATLLTTRGIPTRSQILGEKLGRGDKPAPWSKSSVKSVLTNPIYKGVVVHGLRTMKLNKETGRRVARRNETHESYQDDSLAIIPTEQWEAVNARLTQHKVTTGAARSAGLTRAFTGLLFCECCGSALYSRKASSGDSVYVYYQCGCRQRRGPEACPNAITLREDKLLDALQEVKELAFEDIDGMVEEVVAGVREQLDQDQGEAGRIRGELADLDKKIRGLMPLLVDPDIDKMAKVAISKQLGEYQTRSDDLNGSLSFLLAKSHGEMGELVERARAKLVALRDRWDAIASMAQLNKLLSDFVGPSTVSAEGLLLPMAPKEKPGVRGVGTLRRSDPVHSLLASLLRATWNGRAA